MLAIADKELCPVNIGSSLLNKRLIRLWQGVTSIPGTQHVDKSKFEVTPCLAVCLPGKQP